MDPDNRLDYFRSELEGKLAQVRNELVVLENRLTARIATLEKSLETAVRELHNARLGR